MIPQTPESYSTQMTDARTIRDLLASPINFILNMNALDSFITTSSFPYWQVKNEAQELFSSQEKINNTQLLIPSAPPAFSPKSSDFRNRTKERYEVQSWLRVWEKRGQRGGTEMVMRQNSCLLWLWQERPLGNRGAYSRERQSGEVASAQGLSF